MTLVSWYLNSYPPLVLSHLAGGQSELEASLNLNEMNNAKNKPHNPWHVSFSYARALQNTVLKTWQGNPANVEKAQAALLARAKVPIATAPARPLAC